MGDGTVVTGVGVGTVVITGAGVVVLLLPSSEGIKKNTKLIWENGFYTTFLSLIEPFSIKCRKLCCVCFAFALLRSLIDQSVETPVAQVSRA